MPLRVKEFKRGKEVMGYAINGQHHLIIASDHSQGVFLPLDLSEQYDIETLVGRLQKFVALSMSRDDDN